MPKQIIAHFFDDIEFHAPKSVMDLDRKEKFKMTDALIRGTQHLDVTVAATHSARITKNNTLYLPTKMREGTPTLLSRADGGTATYPRPVFINHNKFDPNADPIGRVHGAEYIDLSNNYLNSNIADCVQDANMVRPDQYYYQYMDVVKTLMENGTLYDPKFQGMGYIRAMMRISNEDSIKKFMDGRYQTVSTSFSSNKAVCSICREDWADLGEPCDHRPGKWYKGEDGEKQKMFLVAGDMAYDEISVAHKPADDEAVVLSLQGDVAEHNSHFVAKASDSYEPYELMVNVKFNDNFDPEGGHTMTRDEMLAKLKELTPEDTLDTIDKITDTTTDETLAEFLDNVPEVLSAEVLIEALGITVEDSTPPKEDPVVENSDSGNKPKEDPVEVPTLKDTLDKLFADEALTDEEVSVVYGAITSEIDSMIAGNVEYTQLDLATSETISVDLEESKLTDEKISALSNGTFCGPHKTFPITDSAHVAAARKVIEDYEGEGDTTILLSNIDRKARAMGCDSKQKETVTVEMSILEHFNSIADMERAELVALFQAVEDKITEKEILPPVNCKNCSDNEEKMVSLHTQRDDLNQTLEATRAELQTSKDEVESLIKQLGAAFKDHKDALTDGVASMRKLNGTDSSFEDIRNEIADRTTSELKNEYIELRGTTNFDNMNLGSSNSNELPDLLDDPTKPVVEENSVTNSFDNSWVPKVVTRYQELFTDSHVKAVDYIKEMKKLNIIPSDFDINSHLVGDE